MKHGLRPVATIAFLGTVLGAGCSSVEDRKEPEGGAIIASFTATPSTLNAGESTTLRWEVANATGISVAIEGGEALALGPEELEASSVQATPSETTTYVLRATGRDGSTTTREARVQIRAGQPRILRFVATPEAVTAGKEVTLSWATENATEVRLLAEGVEVPVGGAGLPEGSVVLTPAASTRYTLRASNSVSSVTSTAQVTVSGGLDVELTADVARVGHGEGTTLRWRSRKAERIVLMTGEVELLESNQPSGSFPVTPLARTTYEITAYGEDGVATATAEVAVAPVIESFGPRGPGPFVRGGEVELGWSARGARAIRIASSEGWEMDVDPASLEGGRATAPIPADGTLRIDATLEDESASRSVTLPLLDPPEILAFSVTPDRLTVAEGEPGEVRIAWTTARSASVRVDVKGSGNLLVSEEGAGTADVELEGTATLVLEATNAAGSATREVEVHAFPPPAIESFVARPVHVGVGEAFELAWVTTAAVSVVVQQEGVEIHRGPGGSDALAVQIASDSTFLLQATNGAGLMVEREAAVTVGPPRILDFDVDRTRSGPGSSANFSWATLGGVSFTLLGPGGTAIPGCSTQDFDRIPAGNCTVVLPTQLGRYAYKAVLANGVAQFDEESVEIDIADGPTILDFFADATQTTLGETVNFHWTTEIDGQGVAATLELKDGADVYPLGDADPLDGSAAIVPLRAGTRTFRLTASTQGTTPSQRDVVLKVFEAPTISVSASSPVYRSSEGAVTLTWQSEHAVSLVVYEVDDDGVEVEIASFADPLLIASGSLPVVPPLPGRTYRLVATNPAGAKASAEVELNWAGPDILYFEATPADFTLGTSAELEWITSGATAVSIAPAPLVAGEPFVDVSTSPTATVFPLVACGGPQPPADGCVDIGLPFGFPYDGQVRTSARVFLHGAIGFDPTYQGPSDQVAELPSSTSSFVQLAPFWQPLRQSVPGSTRVGRIHLDSGTDLEGAYVVIQWSGFWSASSSNAQVSDLNFQVVLRPSGDFEFRYGAMSSASLPSAVDGSEASIGYQLDGGIEGRSLSFEEAIRGGLGGRSFRVRTGGLQGMGSFSVVRLTPGPSTYTLSATNGVGKSTASATVTAHPPVSLEAVHVVEAFPEAGAPFTIRWTGAFAQEVRVERPQEDPEDEIVVLCTVLPSDPQECVLEEPTAGDYAYVARAIGGGAFDEAVVELEVEVLPVFSIDAFTALPTAISPGEEVTLSWTTTNAEAITLTANGEGVDVGSLSPLGDSLTLTLDESTDFVLTAMSRGRTKSEISSVTVEDPPEEEENPPEGPPEE